MSNKPLPEVPQGAIRLNTDSQKLEFYAQDRWYEMATEFSSPIAGRGLFIGGSPGGSPNYSTNTIDFINISTQGDAIDFGDTNYAHFTQSAGLGSRIRAVYGGGYWPSGNNSINFNIFATQGNGVDFGDMQVSKGKRAGCNDSTRGIIAGGGSDAPNHSNLDTIDFITIDIAGNAADFGNLSQTRDRIHGFSSPTRGVFCGGLTGPSGGVSTVDTVDFITIQSTGNAADFGNLTAARNMSSTAANNVRGFCLGGANSPAMAMNTIDFCTISTTGNFTDFGDLIFGGRVGGAVATPIRIVQGQGIDASANRTQLQYITINTLGNSSEFGDLTVARNGQASASNTNGGL